MDGGNICMANTLNILLVNDMFFLEWRKNNCILWDVKTHPSNSGPPG